VDGYEREIASRVAEKVVGVPLNAATELCEFNPRRIALLFCSSVGSTIVATQSKSLTLQVNGQIGGFSIPFGQTFVLSRKLHGALCMSQWFGLNGAAADAFTVIEVLEP
jgi:hypothetical protein